MTTSSIPIGEAFHRLLHYQRLKAKQLLLDVQRLELSVRFFMSAQDDLNAAVDELVTAAQAAADMLKNSVGGDAAESAAQRLHDAASSLKAATDAVSAGGAQPSTAPSDGSSGATPPAPEPAPVAANPNDTSVVTNPDGSPVSGDPSQL